MRVLTICGAGLGCSLLLKMFVQDVFDKLCVPVEIEATDVSFGKGMKADLIITSTSLLAVMSDVSTPVIGIQNLIDRDEIERKLRAYFEQQPGKQGTPQC